MRAIGFWRGSSFSFLGGSCLSGGGMAGRGPMVGVGRRGMRGSDRFRAVARRAARQRRHPAGRQRGHGGRRSRRRPVARPGRRRHSTAAGDGYGASAAAGFGSLGTGAAAPVTGGLPAVGGGGTPTAAGATGVGPVCLAGCAGWAGGAGGGVRGSSFGRARDVKVGTLLAPQIEQGGSHRLGRRRCGRLLVRPLLEHFHHGIALLRFEVAELIFDIKARLPAHSRRSLLSMFNSRAGHKRGLFLASGTPPATIVHENAQNTAFSVVSF